MDTPKKKILIIEDDPSMLEGYKLALLKLGYEIDVAKNGAEGLEKANATNYDLILLDLLMPVMDGVQFLKAYDAKTKHPNTKIIVFTNSQIPEHTEEAMKLGAVRYLEKIIVSPKKMVQTVEELLHE